MNNKEELLEQLKILKEKQKEVKKQIKDIDSVDLYAKNKQYVGKCFKCDDGYQDFIRCVLIYGMRTERSWTALEITYYVNTETHFSIQHIDHFNPIEDNFDEWVEIDRKEFDEHYKEVQRFITSAYLK